MLKAFEVGSSVKAMTIYPLSWIEHTCVNVSKQI